MRIITLTTDFGLKDPYVGIMKGIILSICPQARVVDLTHEIPPQDIKAAALAIKTSYPFFPKETIHVVVVDPEVGSQRRPLAVKTARGIFIAPDNGVLEFIYQTKYPKTVYHLTNKAFFRNPISSTFHGRDIFAPVAAHLACGVNLDAMGEPINDYVRLNWPVPQFNHNRLIGEIIYIDRFGNLITNISKEVFKKFCPDNASFVIIVNDMSIHNISPYYAFQPTGSLIALWDSSDLLEIACVNGNAQKKLGVSTGTKVVIKRSI